jgi:6-phosphogluconate dehydrogenase
MQLGFVGLGRMGLNMVTRLVRGGHEIVAYDRSADAVTRAEGAGARGVRSLDALVSALAAPRAVWVMVPAGAPTDSTITALEPLLAGGDTIVDGGNTNFHDDVRRAEALRAKRIRYVDAGVSGGIWGLQEGYCLMVGGDADPVKRLEPVFVTLAPTDGYLHVGGHGSGHYVKMIHNGIEYGLMQAYAEGLDILKNASAKTLDPDLRYDLNIADVTEVWRRGSVVSSWLLDLTAQALAENPTLSNYEGVVADSGEGRWTVMAAVEEGVPADVLSASLYARFRSRQDHTFAEKVLSAMRQKFGGHVEQKSG